MEDPRISHLIAPTLRHHTSCGIDKKNKNYNMVKEKLGKTFRGNHLKDSNFPTIDVNGNLEILT